MPASRTCPSVMLDEIVFHGRAACDMLIHCTLVFSGKVDAERMQRAVRLSLKAEPILGCRFRAGRWRGHWVQPGDPDTADVFRVETTGHPAQRLNRFLTRSLDPFEDLHVQVRIFRSDCDTLCIKMNHIIVDAGGVKEYAYLLASIYRQLGDDPHFCPPVNMLEWQARKRSLRQILQLFRLKDYANIFKRTLIDNVIKSSPARFINPVLPGEKRTDCYFAIHRIEPPLFRALKQYGQKRDATVNDMVVTAVFRALFGSGIEDRRRFRLITTADLRRYKSVWKGEAPCNLSGLCYLDIGRHIPPLFEETLAKISEYMKRLKPEAIGLGDMGTAVLLTRLMPMHLREKLFSKSFQRLVEQKDRFAPGMTNMGRIDDRRLNFGTPLVTEAFLTAPLLNPPIYIIGVSGFKESLHISIGIGDSGRNRFMAEKLLDRIDAEFYQALWK